MFSRQHTLIPGAGHGSCDWRWNRTRDAAQCHASAATAAANAGQNRCRWRLQAAAGDIIHQIINGGFGLFALQTGRGTVEKRKINMRKYSSKIDNGLPVQYLRLEDNITANHVQFNADSQHWVIQTMSRVVALEQETTWRFARASVFGKIQIDKAELVVAATTLHFLAYRDAQLAGIQHTGRCICAHLAGKLEAAIPFDAMIAHFLAAKGKN